MKIKIPKYFTTVTDFSKLVALILLVFFPIIGFELGMQYQLTVDAYRKKMVEMKTKDYRAIASPTPTIAIIDTSTWKMYTNPQLGFSFKYPPNQSKMQLDNEIEYSKRTKSNIPTSFTSFMGYTPPKSIGAVRVIDIVPSGVISANDLFFSVWVFDNSNNLTHEQWNQKYMYYPFTWGKMPPIKDQKTTVDKFPAYYSVQDNIGRMQFIYAFKDTKTFLFAVQDEPKTNSLGNQILSTFQFASATPAAQVGNKNQTITSPANTQKTSN